MRVLFAAIAEKTHFMTMAPLAWALRTAGHDVRFASQPGFAQVITQAGLTAVPVGRDIDMWQINARDPDWTWVRGVVPTPYDVAENPQRATWPYLKDGYAGAVRTWHKPENFPVIAALVDFARHWRPDLIIWEPYTFAGSIAARSCGAAHARLLWSIDIFGVTRDHYLRLLDGQPAEDRTDPLAEWLGGYARKFGTPFAEDMVTGHFTIDQLPDSLRTAADLHYVRMRYVPYGGPAVVPKWLWDRPAHPRPAHPRPAHPRPAHPRPARPRVALTMGLSTTDHDVGYDVPVQDVLDALADLDIELVATIAEAEQRKLERIPDNARLVSYVPLQALLPTCAAVIHHAGYGTLLTIAQYPVPQLAVPCDFDEPELARRLTEHGCALAVRASEATGRTVRECILRLLREPAFRERASQLHDEMLALPTANQLVAQLEELTARYQTAGR
jgi:UDP:flavonoid glycosyltransferase YjiC (YdhE family)